MAATCSLGGADAAAGTDVGTIGWDWGLAADTASTINLIITATAMDITIASA
jgi:hypothetical protein